MSTTKLMQAVDDVICYMYNEKLHRDSACKPVQESYELLRDKFGSDILHPVLVAIISIIDYIWEREETDFRNMIYDDPESFGLCEKDVNINIFDISTEEIIELAQKATNHVFCDLVTISTWLHN